MEKMTERRRRDNMFKSIVLPITVAVVTGVGASYIATQIHVAVLKKQVEYIENDIISIRDILQRVTENQTEIAKQAASIQMSDKKDKEQDARLDRLENNTILKK